MNSGLGKRITHIDKNVFGDLTAFRDNMGLVKRAWEEEMKRGYSLNEGKTVCTGCFEEYGLKQFIVEHHTHSTCSYCGKKNKNVIACELDILIEYILLSICSEWGNPSDEGVPWESREGGWQLADVYDTWDLLEEIGLGNIHGQTFEDICNSIHNDQWCVRNPFSMRFDRILLFGWNAFSYFVKHKVRYFFLNADNPDYDKDELDEMNPVKILDSLGGIVKKVDLLSIFDKNISIKRVRIVDPSEDIKGAKELGAPPMEKANLANRMSPAGIPLFYGAFDIDTAIKETYKPCKKDKKAICGIFELNRELNVIDLSKKISVPSLFDEHHRNKRSYMRFLVDFIDDFSKPIDRNDSAHINYVPTQIVTEYFRYIFKTSKESQIDGIIYPSSKNSGKKAIVIFATSKQCIDPTDISESNLTLKLKRIISKDLKGI